MPPETPPTQSQASTDIQRLSPDRLLLGFSNSRLGLAVLVALVIHVLFIGALSIEQIHGWIDPQWKARQAQAKSESAANPPPAAPVAATAAATQATKPAGTAGNGARTEAQLLEERKNSPVVKQITESATTQELPREPDLGIRLEDTNRR